MPLPEKLTGYRGQRYEHWCLTENCVPVRLGWSNHPKGVMRRIVATHPRYRRHWSVDLTAKVEVADKHLLRDPLSGKWYFKDEVGNSCGPFATKELASKMLEGYAAHLNEGVLTK